MKEVKEWDNRPRPMWVWDDRADDKKRKRFVIYIRKGSSPVIAVLDDGTLNSYDHCAEIKQRTMTHRDLSRWLREKPDREWKRTDCKDCVVFTSHTYMERDANDYVMDMVIREGDGEWREPTMEEEDE